MADTKRRIKNEEIKKETTEPEAVSQSTAMQERMESVSRKILITARNELYMKMRFLDVALSCMPFIPDTGADGMGTDGLYLYYDPQYLGGLFREDRVMVNRIYLHLVLHCIFRHVFRRNGREKTLWNLATDIAVESVIDDWNLPNIRKSQSWLRQRTYRDLKEEIKVFTAEKIYGVLVRWKLSDREMERMIREFTVDDHKYWAKDEDDEKQSEMNQRWQDISEKMQTDMETFSKEATSNTGHFLDQVRVENRQRYDYRSFLHKFAVLKEEVTVDDDSFDYVFYSYGLRLYGNMPLIEPQEWKEVKKVEDFAIVIDTSMSCSGDLVKKFLEETYGILSEAGSFFQRVNIHIIQCDDQVQSDRKITCKEELQEYMEKLDLAGEGGTDFRPAFAYIDDLIATHRFTELKGVIYFTDGQGIYPQKMPLYQTAFVFMDDGAEEQEVPPWAMKLVLDEEDLRGVRNR